MKSDSSNRLDTSELQLLASVISSSDEQTQAIGKWIARNVSAGETICLSGQLGAGKTQFAKGFAMEFGADETSVVSPTFGLLNLYCVEHEVAHMDVYRLGDEDEFLNLGPEEIFESDQFLLVEWGERFQNLLPDETLFVEFELESKSERKLNFFRKNNIFSADDPIFGLSLESLN